MPRSTHGSNRLWASRASGTRSAGGGRSSKAGRAVLEWEPTTDHAFPAGDGWIVHGGMVTAILDSAMGSATWSLLDRDEVYLTADLRTELYRPTRLRRIRATGWVVRKTQR